MANNPVTRNVLKFKGSGNPQVFPNLPTMINDAQDGANVGTDGTLATLEAPDAGNFAANRNVEFLNDRLALCYNGIAASSGVYKRNQGGDGQWGRVSGGGTTPQNDGSCTGLHVLHPDGVPTLAMLEKVNSSGGSFRVRRTTDGTTGADWVSAGSIIEATGNEPVSYGQSIKYRNSIVWLHEHFSGAAGSGNITQYDLVTQTLTRYNIGVNGALNPASWQALHVHDNVLFFCTVDRAVDDQMRIYKLAGGLWELVWDSGLSNTLTGTTNAHPALFTDFATGNLMIIFPHSASGDRVFSIADATGVSPTPTDVTSTALGATEGADKYAAGGGSISGNRRWSVFVDTQTDPTAPRTFLTTWVPGGSTETWEWKGIAAEMEAVAGLQGVSDDFALPYETVGGGLRSPRIAAVELEGVPIPVVGGLNYSFRGHGSAPAGTLSFRGSDDEGSPSTLLPVVAASLTVGAGMLVDLEAYYQLNEASGARVDSSGNSRDLVETGTVGSGTGVIGNGGDFPGTNGNYLARGVDDNELDIGLALVPFAVQAWVDVDALAGASGGITPVCKSNDSTNGWALNIENDGTVRWLQGGAPVCSSAAGIITVGAGLQHIVATSDGSLTKIYVDTVEVASGSSVAVVDSADQLIVGNCTATNAGVDGVIDEVAVWSRHVIPVEITALYNTGSGKLLTDATALPTSPTISGNTVINFTPDNGVTTYTISLNVSAAGITAGDVATIIPGLVV